MPNISFRQLSSYIKDLKKNNKSENAIFKLLIQQAEAFGGLLHDNHKLTTQDERQDIYGDIKEYLDAYDKAFGGDPKNAQENESLANINAIGERLSAKLNTIGTKPGNGVFRITADDFVTNIANNSKAMHEGVLRSDIDRYTNNSYYALQRANQLVNEKKLDAKTAELMNHLNANLIAVTNNGAMSLEDQHAAARSISHIVVFYNDNLFDAESRSKINSAEPIAPLAQNVGILIAENKVAVENLRKVNADAAEKLEAIVNKTSEDLQTDLNAITTMATANKWAEWEYRTQMYRKEEEQKIEQDMQDQGYKNQDQLMFQKVIDNDPGYKEVPFLNNIIAVLGINENDIPENMSYTLSTGKTITRNMHNELRELKRLAVSIATITAERFDPNNKDAHMMSDAEMESMFNQLIDFESQASRFVRPLKANKTAELVSDTVEEARKAVSYTSSALNQTRKYVENYGGENIDKDTKVFSLYELQGRMNPDAHAGFLRYVDSLKRRGAEIESKAMNKGGKAYTNASNAYREVKESVRKLTEEIIPDVFKHSADLGEDTVNPVKPEQLKALYEGYKNIYLNANEFIRDYDKRVAKNAKFAEGEKEFFEDLKAVSARAAGKFILLGYLLDENENTLTDEITNYNNTPAQQRQGAENAAFYEYAMSCKEHIKNGTLLPQYLFEDHKSPRVTHILSMMNAKKDIDAAYEFEKNAAKIKWEGGKRKLDSLKEYDLLKKQTGVNDNIYQFATHMDHENFMNIFNKSILNLPQNIKEVKLTDPLTGEKVTVNVEEYMRKAIDEHILYSDDGKGGRKPVSPSGNLDFYNTQDGKGGFFTQFERDFEDMDPDLAKFIEQLNRNLYNAGFCEDARMKNVPAGYNEGHAREFAYELSLSTGSEGLLPTAKMKGESKIPLAGGKAKFDQVSVIQIGEMQPNYDVTSKQSKNDQIFRPSFYTTTKNFRSSDFVGELGGRLRNDVVNNEYLKGKTEKEMSDFLKQRKEELKRRIQNGTYSAFTSAASRDYNSFNKPQVLKNAADLQVMDYLMGIKKRKPDDIRIRFQIDTQKTDSKGRYLPEVQGIGGAFTDDVPFARGLDISEEEKGLLTNPEDMLIISEKMESELRRWKKGQFMPKEKELLEKLPEKSREAFMHRVNGILLQVDLSKDHKFEDIRDEEGNIVPGGFKVEKGYIRVVSDEEFKNIHMDDLAIARNKASFRDRDKVEPVNIFDTIAAMPKACHEALKDKTNAQFLGVKDEKRGAGLDKAFLIDNSRSDAVFQNMELERMLRHSKTLLTDANAMDKDRSQEYGWHKNISGDSIEYMKVMETAADISDWADKLPLLMNEEKKYLANRQAYAENNKEAAEFIRKERRERLEFAQNLAREKGLPVPDKLPPASEDPNFYFSLMKRNEKLRHRIENYLTKKNKPGTDFGKMRQRCMVDMYNKVNRQMEELAYYTGITTYPPRKCTINPDFSVKFENVYKDRYTFETEGVKPVYAKKFISEFKAANKANRNIAERFNTSKQYEMHNKPRYIELSAKVNKKTATAEEKEELKTLRFNEQRDGKTGYREEEIGKSLTKYPDPNKKSGRAANPKFDTIFSNLRAIKDDIPVIESKNHQKIEVYGHQNNQPKIKINH